MTSSEASFHDPDQMTGSDLPCSSARGSEGRSLESAKAFKQLLSQRSSEGRKSSEMVEGMSEQLTISDTAKFMSTGDLSAASARDRLSLEQRRMSEEAAEISRRSEKAAAREGQRRSRSTSSRPDSSSEDSTPYIKLSQVGSRFLLTSMRAF